MSDTPILRGPNWTLPFHISTDASDSSLGVVLGQKEGQQHYAIYFISKNLTPIELNYTITEKEFLAVIYAIIKFVITSLVMRSLFTQTIQLSDI